MTRLALPQVTLVAVDTRAPLLAAQALLRSMAGIDFAKAVLFTHEWTPRRPLPGIEIVDIDPITSSAEYSHFMLRLMPGWVRTSHVLITQWDAFVVEPWAWNNNFLAYDYVGAPWPDQPDARAVGNGRFSLRSRRLLAAGMDLRIDDSHPEDVALCRTYRTLLEREHGVTFAPLALARRFAYENDDSAGPTFGFHGAYNLPRVLDEPTLATWLDILPDDFFRCDDARRLARALVARMPTLAKRVIDRRQRVGQGEPGTRLLDAAASVFGLLGQRPEALPPLGGLSGSPARAV
jgi:hypothetical protein